MLFWIACLHAPRPRDACLAGAVAMAVLGGGYSRQTLGNLWFLSSDPALATFISGALPPFAQGLVSERHVLYAAVEATVCRSLGCMK